MVLFPRYHGLLCWKPAFCAHCVWRYSSLYQEVQHSLCDYRDGGFPWTTRLHQILFQVRENLLTTHRMSEKIDLTASWSRLLWSSVLMIVCLYSRSAVNQDLLSVQISCLLIKLYNSLCYNYQFFFFQFPYFSFVLFVQYKIINF